MKLDRLKFATLIGYIGYRTQFPFSKYDIAEIDELIDIDVIPVEVPGKADPATVNELMRAIHAGEKIAAIKAYRTLTGYGLKEAKDAVENGWPPYDPTIRLTKNELYKKLNEYTEAKMLNNEQDNVISTFINYAY